MSRAAILLNAAIECNPLQSPNNGGIIFSPDDTAPYSHGTTAQYMCDIGYALVGESTQMTCGGFENSTIGIWMGDNTPRCGMYCIFLAINLFS